MEDYSEEEAFIGICGDCIDDEFLSDSIKLKGNDSHCDICKAEKTVLTLADIAEYVHKAFEQHYEFGRYNPYHEEQEGEVTESIIEELLAIDFRYCEILRRIMASDHKEWGKHYDDLQPYGDNVCYVPVELDWPGIHSEWTSFEKIIREQARFFGKKTKQYLDEIFRDLDELTARDNNPVLTHIGPGTDLNIFYRGRFFHDERKLLRAMERPDLEIGPPPAEFAIGGRMNAKGISVFYGATNVDVALAEIRPPVGSTVVMGEFELTQPLRVLNLALIKGSGIKGSVFDPAHIGTVRRISFLQSLVRIMTRPTNPLNESEYLPTQVIADYLANAYPGNIDGILYPSSQSKAEGLNMVLFHHTSKVVPLDLPKGLRFRSDTSEHIEGNQYRPYYSVTEILAPKKNNDGQTNFAIPVYATKQTDTNEVDRGYLTINPNLLKVHEIKPILIDTEEYAVNRIRMTDIKPSFNFN